MTDQTETRAPVDLEKIARGVRLVLEGIGEDPDRAALEIAAFFKEETARWRKVISDAKIEPK